MGSRQREACTKHPLRSHPHLFLRARTPYVVTSLSAAYAVCKTKGGLGGSPKKRRVNVETSAPRSFLKNRYPGNLLLLKSDS